MLLLLRRIRGSGEEPAEPMNPGRYIVRDLTPTRHVTASR